MLYGPTVPNDSSLEWAAPDLDIPPQRIGWANTNFASIPVWWGNLRLLREARVVPVVPDPL